MRSLFLVVVLLFVFIPAHAQSGAAELTGTLRTQTNELVASANVKVTELNTNSSSSTTTNGEGLYVVTNLRPGLYSIQVEAIGFKRVSRNQLSLTTGERLRVDFTLEPGSITESVTIIEPVPLLRSESGSLGQVIQNRKIANIPLNGRNFLSLVSLSAGVAQPPPTSAGPSFPRINGGRPRTNEYMFDGVSVLQPEPGQVAFFPIPEAIQEFKVEVNSPPAEFGRFNGGVVNLTTRAGTNVVYGSAFEFLRNEALNARNLFAPPTTTNPNKPVFRRNQFGRCPQHSQVLRTVRYRHCFEIEISFRLAPSLPFEIEIHSDES